MAFSLTQVYGKAKAYVDALCQLPRSQFAAVPTGRYGRDFNTLRRLTLLALPELDERLLGKDVPIRKIRGGSDVCDASFIEIQTYARQILEQLADVIAVRGARASNPKKLARSFNDSEKAYDVEAIRRQHQYAYAPWSAEDDRFLRSRFREGATIDDLAGEFGRQPGGIRSRLRKLGLDGRRGGAKPLPPSDDRPKWWRELRPRAGRVWTPDEDEELVRRFKDGLPLEKIAESLGRGAFSVEVRLCKLGGIKPKGV
jgi:hypothetical protein